MVSAPAPLITPQSEVSPAPPTVKALPAVLRVPKTLRMPPSELILVALPSVRLPLYLPTPEIFRNAPPLLTPLPLSVSVGVRLNEPSS